MYYKNEPWSMLEIIKGKTFLFLVLTIILTFLFKNIANDSLNYFLNKNNDSFYSPQYSFGLYSYILALPASLLSILIIKTWLKLRNFFQKPSNNKAIYKEYEQKIHQEKKFKWYSLYGIAIGFFVVLPILLKITNDPLEKYINNDFAYMTANATILFTSVLSSFIINKIMIHITNTNEDLLSEISLGKYDSHFKNEQDKTKIIKILKRGRMSSVKGALFYLFVLQSLIIVSKWFIYTFLAMISVVDNAMGRSNSKSRTLSKNNAHSNYPDNKKNIKKEAQRDAKNKQEKANAAWKHAGKQARHNPNTIHLKERLKKAESLQKSANKSKEYEKKL